MTYEAKRDIYQTITDKVIADLERGVRPWHRPWTGGNATTSRPLRANGIPYQGINVVLLWIEASLKGYASPTWMTFKQAQEVGACVRKGEKGSMVVYANAITKTETDASTGEDSERRISFLKSYTVFNVAQIDGLRPMPSALETTDRLTEADRMKAVDMFFAMVGADLRHAGSRAFYAPALDAITLPPFAAFESPGAYYATLGHEHIHWTGHSRRLDRLEKAPKASEPYAREELVAELGSAFLCADLGVSDEPREDHASYLASWLKVLREDKRAIVTAASAAQRAVNFLHEKVGALPQDDEAAAA
jgi:antirestriction protein ArdC